jgi:hypothetical protein
MEYGARGDKCHRLHFHVLSCFIIGAVTRLMQVALKTDLTSVNLIYSQVTLII